MSLATRVRGALSWVRANPLLSFAIALVVFQGGGRGLRALAGVSGSLQTGDLAADEGPGAGQFSGHRSAGPRCAGTDCVWLPDLAFDLCSGGGAGAGRRGTLGLLAAWWRGWFERVFMRLMDVVFAFPILLLAIGVIAVLGPNAWSAAIAIAVVYTPIFARLLRGPAMVIIGSEYVLGARAIGASGPRILLRHVLPNLMSVILVQTSILLSAAILVEASLSFLGLGAQPPVPSLGLMLSEGRNFLLLAPWPAIFAGLAILFLSFGFNLLGDALRDRLDPRLR